MVRKLFATNPARMGRFEYKPAPDAAPETLVNGTPEGLKSDLISLLGADRFKHRAIDLVRYASDASPYRVMPQVLVAPRSVEDIIKIFRYCRENGRHATFRAAGTSLNGQSQSDDILIDVRRHWYGATIEKRSASVRARSGMILGHVNSMLAKHGRQLGPDPASAHAAAQPHASRLWHISPNSGDMVPSERRPTAEIRRSVRRRSNFFARRKWSVSAHI